MKQDRQRGGPPPMGGADDPLEHRLRGDLRAWLDPLEPPPSTHGSRVGRRIRGPGALGVVGAAIVVVALLAGPRLATVFTAPAASGSPVASALAAAGATSSPTEAKQSGPSAESSGCLSATQPGAPCGASAPASGGPAPNASASATAGGGPATPTAGTAGASAAPTTPRTPAPVPTPTPVPVRTAAPRPTPGASAAQPVSVTLADEGATLRLRVGDSFLLDLGLPYDWSVDIADQSIVSRVPNILVIRGAQGVYQARAVGSTSLTATGSPTCLSARPPCALPSRLFRLEIVVQ